MSNQMEIEGEMSHLRRYRRNWAFSFNVLLYLSASWQQDIQMCVHDFYRDRLSDVRVHYHLNLLQRG